MGSLHRAEEQKNSALTNFRNSSHHTKNRSPKHLTLFFLAHSAHNHHEKVPALPSGITIIFKLGDRNLKEVLPCSQMTILTWWRVEGRQWSASNSGIFPRCKLNSPCSADSRWSEGHTLPWQDASPCRCSENTGAGRCGTRWRACYSPCSCQTAGRSMMTHESPRSLHNEVFLHGRKSLKGSI